MDVELLMLQRGSPKGLWNIWVKVVYLYLRAYLLHSLIPFLSLSLIFKCWIVQYHMNPVDWIASLYVMTLRKALDLKAANINLRICFKQQQKRETQILLACILSIWFHERTEIINNSK